MFWGAERMALTYVDSSHGTPAPILIHPADGSPVTIPDAALLFSAEFSRDHGDLVLRNPGSPDIRVVDYFDAGTPPDLQSPEGAVIRGATVALLAGPEAPGQYAQAGAIAAGEPIGQVETLSGEATVQRADGTVETLGQGDKIFLNDVLQTGGDGRLAVTFVDGTIFTLSAASRMVVDELIYDPAGQDNFGGFNLIQGSFVFIAGQVAKTGGMDVNTPSATMGIKGTTVLVEIGTDNGVATAQVTLLRDPDGDVGRVELFDLSRNLIATISEANASWVISTVDGETREVERGSAPDDADSTIIADAVAAYQSAFGRVGAGGSFVELDNVLRGGTGGGDGQGGDGIDLDSDDLQELPELAPPPVAPLPGDGSFDDGRNGYVPPGPIRVTGDSSGSVVDGGTTVADGSLDADEPDVAASLVWSGSAEGAYGTFTDHPRGRLALCGQARHRKTRRRPVGGGELCRHHDRRGRTDRTADDHHHGGGLGRRARLGDAGLCRTGRHQGVRWRDHQRSACCDRPRRRGEARVVRLRAGRLRQLHHRSGRRLDLRRRLCGHATRGRPDRDRELHRHRHRPDRPHRHAGDLRDDHRQRRRPRLHHDARERLGRGYGQGHAARPRHLPPPIRDAGAVLTWSGSTAGAYGSFTVTPNGAWTYAADPALRALDEGDTATETFTATVTDDTGRTATQVVTVLLTGAGDAPVSTTAPASAFGIVTDGGAVVATGTLTASDADAGAALTWSGSGAGAYGTFSVAANGTWTYVANANLGTLGEGQTATETFTATVTDETGRTATQIVTVNLAGEGDGPVSTTPPRTHRAP